MHRRWFRLSALLLMMSLLLPLSASASALDDVRTTVEQVLVVLRNKELPVQERRDQLSKLIRARFDFEIMSQSTLGRQWKKASPEEQANFIRLYSDLLEATYLGRIEAYTDEKVAFGEEKVRGDKALVETRIVTKSVEVPIDYKLVQHPEGWMVYDVVIEGVSLIRNFRSSYGEIVDREGFSGLFDKMEQKVAELRQ